MCVCVCVRQDFAWLGIVHLHSRESLIWSHFFFLLFFFFSLFFSLSIQRKLLNEYLRTFRNLQVFVGLVEVITLITGVILSVSCFTLEVTHFKRKATFLFYELFSLILWRTQSLDSCFSLTVWSAFATYNSEEGHNLWTIRRENMPQLVYQCYSEYLAPC